MKLKEFLELNESRVEGIKGVTVFFAVKKKGKEDPVAIFKKEKEAEKLKESKKNLSVEKMSSSEVRNKYLFHAKSRHPLRKIWDKYEDYLLGVKNFQDKIRERMRPPVESKPHGVHRPISSGIATTRKKI